MPLHIATSGRLITIKRDNGHQSDGGDFGIVEFAVRISFWSRDFEGVSQEALNCNGFVSLPVSDFRM